MSRVVTGCPDPSVLESFTRGSLQPDARSRLEQHLDGCTDCSQTIAELARLFGSASMPARAPAPMAVTVTTASDGANPSNAEHPAGVGAHPAGATVGRYQLGRPLGAGGMGVVFEAYDPQLDRQVAIKLLHPGQNDEAEITRSRLLREARAMARLAHPNVVAVHDVGRVGEQVFVAMELVEGHTLSSWLAASRRTQAQIIERFVQAGRGLAAAHEVGLVHRDFKPENVLIGADQRARVTDFGLAQPVMSYSETEPMSASPGVDSLRASVAVTTAFGTIVGTPAYMAPEQWRAESVDARTDQFSFCVALFEALFGTRPFDGDNWMMLSSNVLDGRMKPPPRSAPGWLRGALTRGLAVAPGQRHPSMAQLLAALSRDRSGLVRVAAIGGAMVVGAAATVGVLAWAADETSPLAAVADGDTDTSSGPDSEAEPDEAPAPTVDLASTAPAPGVEACQALAKTVDGRFGASRRTELEARIDAMDDAAASIAMVMPTVDRWVNAYVTQAEALCQPSADLTMVEERRQCLADRSVALDGWLLRVQERERFRVEDVLAGSAFALPPVDRCGWAPWLVAMPAVGQRSAEVQLLRADLAAARADLELLELAGLHEQVERIVTAAVDSGDAAVQAEAQLLMGAVGARRYEPDAAVPWLLQAATSAQTAGHGEVQAEAAVMLMEQQGAGQLQAAAAKRWQRVAQSLAERTQDPRVEAAVSLAEGRMLHATFELRAAETALSRAVDEHREVYGSGHPNTALAMVALAELLHDKGDAAEAETKAAAAVTVLRKVLGAEDLRLANALTTLARTQRGGNKLDAALASVNAALKIAWISSSVRHDYDRGDALLVLGDIQIARGEVVEGLETLTRAEISHYVGPRMAQPFLARGRQLVGLGRAGEAIAPLQRALTELQNHYVADDPRLVEVLSALGQAQAAAGKSDDARTTLTRALTIADESLGFGAFKSRALVTLAKFEQDAGQDARALELYDDAHVALLGAYEMGHPRLVETLLARADLAYALGNRSYAGRLYRSTLDRFIDVYGSGSDAVARARARQTDD